MASLANSLELRNSQRLSVSPAVRQALHLLRMNNRDLSQFLETIAADNPWIELLNRTDGAVAEPLAGSRHRAGAAGSGGISDFTDRLPAAANSLIAHVLAGVEARFPSGRLRDIALAFVEALEPVGWISTTPAKVAALSGCSIAEAEAVLDGLQRIGPPGLFAQSLADCLRLQAIDAGLFDPVMAVLLDRLDLLAKRDMAALAARAGVPQAEIVRTADVIRSFDPKPGAAFDIPDTFATPPDLIATRHDDGWHVALNHASLPAVVVRDGALHGDGAHAAAERIAGMVGRRNATVLALAGEIVRHQAEALERGRGYLRPLRRVELAQGIGLHESTVSRALAGLRIATPLGVFGLDEFFSFGLGDDVSPHAVQAEIRRLVAAENPGKPLSDQRLCDMLAAAGTPVARRTVAKYRAALRIPSAARRRR